MRHGRGASTQTLRRILALLSESPLDTVPSLDELAAMARMSRFHFSRRFGRVAGMSLRAYITELRVERASTLVLTTTDSLTTIAHECGFYDLPHLDKAFRRRFGVAPNQFRRRSSAVRDGDVVHPHTPLVA
jgi:AraC family transcriptional regulator